MQLTEKEITEFYKKKISFGLTQVEFGVNPQEKIIDFLLSLDKFNRTNLNILALFYWDFQHKENYFDEESILNWCKKIAIN